LAGTKDDPNHISEASSTKKVRFGDDEKGDGKKEANLADGAYDEAESHNAFIEALNAWRNEGKPKEQ
jgi:hypothetical protein